MKIKEIQKLYLRSYLPQLFPAGIFKGDEFIMGDAHGSAGRSFSFNVEKGIGRDFSADKNYNIITLVAAFYNLSTKEAYKKIMRDWGVQKTTAIVPKTPSYIPVTPVPRSAPPLQISGKQGAPSALWEYKNRGGELMFFVARFDDAEGKRYLPFTFDGKKWQAKSMPAPRPLYNLPAFRDDKNFILVEGEKAADAIKTLCPWGIGTTWANGSQAINQTDWQPLAGKKVIIWRDADPINPKTGLRAGQVAQDKICDILHALGCEIRILADDFYANRPDGWDAADALAEGLTPQELQELLKANLQEYKPSQFGSSEFVSLAATEEKTAPLPEPLNRYYRLLGMIGTAFAFYNYTSGQINIEKNSGLTKKFFLSLTNGDQEYWKQSYGYTDNEGELKVAWDSVAGAIMGECNHQGQFDVDTVRGVGVWRDKNKIVVNAGKFLYIDGKKCPIDKFESDFLYQKSSEILHSIDNPLTPKQLQEFSALCDMFSWEHKVSGKLLAGWLMVAPICGCLDWRPHLYICGMAGTGKSTIYREILSRTLGKFKRAYLGDTTEAGVRQRGSNDSLPAIFDEFETDSKQSGERIDKIIRLFRMCSDAHDGRLYKGSQDQTKAVSYTVQSAACFSSITPNIKHFADISRITTLTLKTEYGKETERKENFKNVQRIIAELMGNDRQSSKFAEQFVSYSILNAHNIIASWKVFKEAASAKLGFTARISDQLGMLLAGAWAYKSDKPITLKQAGDFLGSYDWEDLVPNKDQQNQSRLLRTLAQHQYDIDNEDREKPRRYARGVGRLVEYLAHEFADDFNKGHPDGRYFPQSVVREFLLNKGIIVEDGFIYISNNSAALRTIFYNTQWEADWKTTLKAIKGAVIPNLPKYFGTGIGASRCVGIPVGTFLDSDSGT